MSIQQLAFCGTASLDPPSSSHSASRFGSWGGLRIMAISHRISLGAGAPGSDGLCKCWIIAGEGQMGWMKRWKVSEMTSGRKRRAEATQADGNMGRPMAENLAKHLSEQSLPPLLVWNRSSAKLPESSASVKHADSLAAAAQADVVITSLANDEAAKEVYAELFKAAKEKKHAEGGKATIFVDTSTLYPTTSGELEREATKLGLVYLAAPVFGPPPAAKSAQLVFVLSGDPFAKKKILPFLVPSMGRKSIDVGSNVERAASFKLIGNGMIIGVIELLAEGMTLADKSGVGADLLYDWVKEFLPAPSFVGYGAKILNNEFDGGRGFTLTGGLKDATHIRRLASEHGATMPALDAAHRHLVTAKANGGSDLDWSSLVAGPRLAAGLQPWTGRKEHPQDTGFGYKDKDPDPKASLEPQPSGGVKEVRNFD
ncbi:hypothetical protein JCM10207_007111 [Rhodosporidiobolus poonsookiae]